MAGVREDIAKEAVMIANQFGLDGKVITDVQIILQQSAVEDDKFYFQLKEPEK